MNEHNLNSSNNENSTKEESNQNPQENVTENIDSKNEKFRKDATELEQMAVTLIDKGMYNDAISLLRKAIALLVQINDQLKADEVRKKLSEVYILQQQNGSQETPSFIPKKGPPKRMRIEQKVEKTAEEEIMSEPKLATEEHKIKKPIVSEEKKEDDVLKETDEIKEREEIEATETYTELEEKTDIDESEVNRAYELIDQGIELEKSSNFEDAIKVYEQAALLFEKIHYQNVLNNVKSKISELKGNIESESKLEKESIEAHEKKAPESLEKKKEGAFETEEYKMEPEEEGLITEEIPPEQPQELDKTTETIKTVEERYKREIEDEIFQNEITKMVDKAQKMEYNYEIEKKKSIKKKKLFEIKEPYTEILEIYETVKEKLLNRGWNEQASVYSDQINIIQGKLKQDKRLREIETKKIQKQKEYEESIKANNITPQEDIDKLKAVEEKYHKQFEEEEFGKQIAGIVDEAEKLAHEYEIAMRKGKFEEKSPYPEIIEKYEQVKKMLLEKGWREQAEIYERQILIYQEKLERDKKIREIEELKKKKQEEYEDILRIKEKEGQAAIEAEKLKQVEDQYKKKVEDETFEQQITEMLNEAEKLEREYETEKKKAIRNKTFLDLEAPYSKIIHLYDQIKTKLMERGWMEQAEIYTRQIRVCEDKQEKDKILREIEAHKLQR